MNKKQQYYYRIVTEELLAQAERTSGTGLDDCIRIHNLAVEKSGYRPSAAEAVADIEGLQSLIREDAEVIRTIQQSCSGQ